MKIIKLVFEFYRKSIFSTLLLLVILMLTSLEIMLVMGEYEERLFGYKEVKKSLYNGDYVMTEKGGFVSGKSEHVESMETIRRLDGVKGVIYSMNSAFTVLTDKDTKNIKGNYNTDDIMNVELRLYSEDYFKYFSGKIDKGKNPEIADDITGVQCVTSIEDVKVGEYLYGCAINLNGENGYTGEKLPVKVSGTFSDKYKCLNMNSSTSGDVDLEIIYEYNVEYGKNVVIMPISDELINWINNNNSLIFVSPNFYVIYDDNITMEQKDAVRKELSKVGHYAPIDEGVEKWVQSERAYLREGNMLFHLLIFLSVISFLVIYILSTYKKLREFSIYFIHGASKRKIFSIVFLSEILIIIPPIIISEILVKTYSDLKYFKEQAEMLIKYIFYDYHVLIIAACMLGLVMVSTATLWIMISKLSPAEIYRKMIQ